MDGHISNYSKRTKVVSTYFVSNKNIFGGLENGFVTSITYGALHD